MTLWDWVRKARALPDGEWLHMTWAEWVAFEHAAFVQYSPPWPMVYGHLVWIDDA